MYTLHDFQLMLMYIAKHSNGNRYGSETKTHSRTLTACKAVGPSV